MCLNNSQHVSEHQTGSQTQLLIIPVRAGQASINPTTTIFSCTDVKCSRLRAQQTYPVNDAGFVNVLQKKGRKKAIHYQYRYRNEFEDFFLSYRSKYNEIKSATAVESH